MNGEVHRAVEGQDFNVQMASFGMYLRKAARQHGMRVVTRVLLDGRTIEFQFGKKASANASAGDT